MVIQISACLTIVWRYEDMFIHLKKSSKIIFPIHTFIRESRFESKTGIPGSGPFNMESETIISSSFAFQLPATLDTAVLLWLGTQMNMNLFYQFGKCEVSPYSWARHDGNLLLTRALIASVKSLVGRLKWSIFQSISKNNILFIPSRKSRTISV